MQPKYGKSCGELLGAPNCWHYWQGTVSDEYHTDVQTETNS